jgi:hypothetical protein
MAVPRAGSLTHEFFGASILRPWVIPNIYRYGLLSASMLDSAHDIHFSEHNYHAYIQCRCHELIHV